MDLSWFSYIALMVAAHQFCMIFVSVNQFIPIRYLSGFMMCLQMFVGPALAYNGLDEFQTGYYRMQIPEYEYFTYVIPAVLCFILGLNLFAKDLPGERPSTEKIKQYVLEQPNMPYVLIVVGFVASLVSKYFGSELTFVFVVLSTFKFVGLFLIILGNKGLKTLPLILVYGFIVFSSIAGGMFFDLLTWLTFLGAVYAYKFKPLNVIKALFVIAFIILAVVIQQLKGDYRQATWTEGQEASIETFSETLEKKQENNSVFGYESLAKSNLRINQGYIITNIMKTVPDKVPFENGAELVLILESAFFPRFLAPNKLNAGDRFIFMKYSGFPVASGTSMGLSSVGDAYINFGVMGGCVFMFAYGLLFSLLLKYFKSKSLKYPVVLLFATAVFYYPIRPDCELQTILGHLVKASFIIMVVLNLWKHKFMLLVKNEK